MPFGPGMITALYYPVHIIGVVCYVSQKRTPGIKKSERGFHTNHQSGSTTTF